MYTSFISSIQSTFLEPEYGTCGTTELSSFPDLNYTNSHCLIQCSMDSLWKTCKCHLPYMPGKNMCMLTFNLLTVILKIKIFNLLNFKNHHKLFIFIRLFIFTSCINNHMSGKCKFADLFTN